jgi:DNA-binding NarL/FixJ family response regulator
MEHFFVALGALTLCTGSIVKSGRWVMRTGMSKGTVLIIDDHLLIRDTLETLLKTEGFTVISCASGKAGLDLARRNNVGIFLIDYKLPDMIGDEVTAVLRTMCPEAFIIGFSIDSREREFLKAGADKFINKDQLDNKLIPYINERIR